MSKIDIKEIRKQLDEISPWPWDASDTEGAWIKDANGYVLPSTTSNNPFIADAPQTISDLLEALEEQQQKIDKLVDVLSDIYSNSTCGVTITKARQALKEYRGKDDIR